MFPVKSQRVASTVRASDFAAGFWCPMLFQRSLSAGAEFISLGTSATLAASDPSVAVPIRSMPS